MGLNKNCRRFTALLLTICMILSLFGGPSFAATSANSSRILTDAAIREADPNTMESYIGKLLSEDYGSRYAGRVWSDKSVVAYEGSGDFQELDLNMLQDGYNGSVGFDADFLHIYSTLTSSQVVDEYPLPPVDMVIVFDMSASMGQDIRYNIDSGSYGKQAHNNTNDPNPWPAYGVSMEERIKNSRIQVTLDAINSTVEQLMEQNPQNRVAVCCYGANAAVLMPLAHYRRSDTNGDGLHNENDAPYITVGGMETLYYPGDIAWQTQASGAPSDGWYWTNNRDTCYTVAVNVQKNETTVELHENQTWDDDTLWEDYSKTISNNINSENVKAFPGVAKQDAAWKANPSDFSVESMALSAGNYEPGSNDLITTMAYTQELEANDYVGYFTNTQAGIYLAYKQLADTEATTYSEKLTNGTIPTVARVPACIIMSDGGANFGLNEMGTGHDEYTVTDWNTRFGAITAEGVDTPQEFRDYIKAHGFFIDDCYVNDNGWQEKGREIDYLHRLGNRNRTEMNLGDEWYNVYVPGNDTLSSSDGSSWDGLHSLYNYGADAYQDGTLSSIPAWEAAGVLYASEGDFSGTAGSILSCLMTASYMSSVVEEHYQHGWAKDGANVESQVNLTTYTMNVDTAQVPQWARWRLFPSLDPKNFPIDEIGVGGWNDDVTKFGETYGGSSWGGIGGAYKNGRTFELTKECWDLWKTGVEADASMAGNGENRINFLSLPTEGNTYVAGGNDSVVVTNQDVIDNIVYNDRFYDATSANLSEIFDEILYEILSHVFVPITGNNDSGMSDSVTYQDPIGLYMDVKNDSIQVTDSVAGTQGTYDMALLLFGKMYGMVRAGVYDYNWINAYNSTHGNSFTMGWYKGENGENAKKAESLDGGGAYPAGYSSAQAARDDGWVMRLDYNTVIQFVHNMDDGSKTPNEKARNTVYTVYRFACDQEERNKLRINPVYGDEVPETIRTAWEAARNPDGSYPESNAIYKDSDGVYRLSDIRVWIENTGDFVDTEGIAPSTDYTDSLFVNVPAAAVPTQLAEITLGKSGILSYKTNLGEDHGNDPKYCTQSTPLRLFYSIGVANKYLKFDETGVQIGVDTDKIAKKFIEAKTEDGKLYLYSNHFSGQKYTGYGSDEESSYRTIGDSTISFSSSSRNRYYVYQKPLPLYAHAYRVNGGTLTAVDGDHLWTSVENQSGGNGTTQWEDGQIGGGTWAGGMYMGTYNSKAEFDAAYAAGGSTITDSNGVVYDKSPDGIVLLKQDLLEHVRSGPTGEYTSESVSFSSNDYFFMIIEYYLPVKDRQGTDNSGAVVPDTYGGKMAQYVIARKGGEFGSGLQSDYIDNGDMLCWTDMTGRLGVNIEYSSKSTTGDMTRGEPTYGKLFYNDPGTLRTYLGTCGLSGSYLDEAVTYWLGIQKQCADVLEIAARTVSDQESFEQFFHFAVATKPGGLRVGDLFQNMRTKGDAYDPDIGYYENNVTHTSNTYYAPTISSHSGTGNQVIINNYLGNNGRLYVETPTELEVKKTVERNPSIEADYDNTEFDFRLTIPGQSGSHSVIVLKRDGDQWNPVITGVEVKTDEEGYVLAPDGSLALYDGNWIYANDGVDTEAAYASDNGSGEYMLDVTLVPKNGTPPLRNPSGTPTKIPVYKEVEKNGAMVNAYGSLYQCSPVHQTLTLNFGAGGIADFTLKDGYGILMRGLPDGTQYEVRERITPELQDAKWYFKQVQTNSKTYTEGTPADDVYSSQSEFDGTKAYVVSGQTSQTRESVHYINYTTTVKKTELTPGEGVPVPFGEEIEYEISYENSTADEQTIVITDVLDPGLDLVNTPIGATYDPASRTVRWEIPNVKPNTSGTVSLKVKTNADAVVEVKNKATVQVGHNPAQETNEVQNPLAGDLLIEKEVVGTPVEMEKYFEFTVRFYTDDDVEILTPFKCEYSGGSIPVEITSGQTFQLKHGETLRVKDLPVGTHYVVTETPDPDFETSATGDDDYIAYNTTKEAKFVNTSTVTPPPEPKKTEVSPGDGVMVNPWEEILYQISFQNPNNYPTDITITDVLDIGLDFLQASYEDVLLDNTSSIALNIPQLIMAYQLGLDTSIIPVDDPKDLPPEESEEIDDDADPSETPPEELPDEPNPEDDPYIIDADTELYSSNNIREPEPYGDDPYDALMAMLDNGWGDDPYELDYDAEIWDAILSAYQNSDENEDNGYNWDDIPLLPSGDEEPWDEPQDDSNDEPKVLPSSNPADENDSTDGSQDEPYSTIWGNPYFEDPWFEGQMEYEFTVILKDLNGKQLGNVYRIGGAKESEWKNGEVINGENVVIYGVPVGTTYEVYYEEDMIATGIVFPAEVTDANHPYDIADDATLIALNDPITINEGNVTITYDPVTRMVTWEIKDCPAREAGVVDLRVWVNGEAMTAGKVVNSADVQFGQEPAIHTNEVQNPVHSGPSLPSTGGSGVWPLYIGGGILVAAAVIAIVIKKRKEQRD